MPRRSARNKAEPVEVKEPALSLEEVQEKSPKKKPKEPWESASTIYDFTAKTLDGEDVSLDKYKGHVCIIVNVASRCGHTKVNYEQFVELHDKYSEEKGLRILAFPCNQFGSQEAGDAKKIREFVDKKNVKFDMFDKIKVNGPDAHPLFKFLKEKLPDAKGKKPIGWNFNKFIITEEGVPVERFAAGKKPLTLVESLQKLW